MAKAKTPKQLNVHIRFLKRQLVTAEKNLKKAKQRKATKEKPVKRRKAVKRRRKRR